MTNLTVNQKFSKSRNKFNKQSVEIVSMWNNTVLQVIHLQKDDPKKLNNFFIGEDFKANIQVPNEVIGAKTIIPLVINKSIDLTLVVFSEEMGGDVTYKDGSRVSVKEILKSSNVEQLPDINGCFTMVLPDNAKFKITAGHWTFLISLVNSSKLILSPVSFDWASQVYTGLSVAIHALFILLVSLSPSTPSDMSFDEQVNNNRFIKYFLSAAMVEQKEMPRWVQNSKKEEHHGGKGKRHVGAEGQMETTKSDKINGKFAIKGSRNNPNPQMRRDNQKELARNSGILQYISSNALISPFANDSLTGKDPENEIGALLGDVSGMNSGFEGLGIKGTGRGGGGTGEGTIGLGILNTIGHGGGNGHNSGYGNGEGELRKRKINRIGGIIGVGSVQGSLSKGVIRRVIHQHINEIKYCYENALYSQPDLEGRVGIKFIISGIGAVQMAAVESSTLGNSQVENCIANAVRRWTFPQPEGGGVVIVLYPFQFTAPE